MPTPLETFSRVLHQTGLFSLSLVFSLWFADILQVDIWNSMTVQGSQKVGGDRSPAATYFLLGGMSTCYLSKYLWWAYGKVFTELRYNELNCCCFCEQNNVKNLILKQIFPFYIEWKAWAITNCKWVYCTKTLSHALIWYRGARRESLPRVILKPDLNKVHLVSSISQQTATLAKFELI